jgi:hypothetical protein
LGAGYLADEDSHPRDAQAPHGAASASTTRGSTHHPPGAVKRANSVASPPAEPDIRHRAGTGAGRAASPHRSRRRAAAAQCQ